MIQSVFASILVLSIAGAATQESRPLESLVASYLEIQALLAADRFDGIKTPAAAIAAQARTLGRKADPIAAGAKGVAEARDLAAAREAFGKLSTAVIDAAKAAGWKNLDDVKLAYCPMAGESWLQKEPELRNPYYGSSMLQCGEFRNPKK